MRLEVAVGSGSQPQVTVPDVTGKSAAEGRAAIVEAHLTVVTTYAPAGDPSRVGTVLKETQTGASVPAWTQITLTVGR